MKHLFLTIVLALGLSPFSTGSFATAQTRLDTLRIDVALMDNGDALVSEWRTMHVTGEGTELYIPIGNLNGRDICELRVSDNTWSDGYYTLDDPWDVDRSRTAKAHRCGYVHKNDGYELCWGLGEEGVKTFLTEYRITHLVQSYDTCDGFNWMFVNPGIKPLPQRVELRIHADTVLSYASGTRIWAFGCHGDFGFDSLGIYMQSDGSFDGRERLVMLCQFPKGLLHPTQQGTKAWENVKSEAMEGSDYEEDNFWGLLGIAISFILCGIVPIWMLVQKLNDRRKIRKQATYWRDPMFGGSLMQANGGYNYLKFFTSAHDNLLSAFILKMLYYGNLKIVKVQDKKGVLQDAIQVCGPEPQYTEKSDNDAYLKTWQIFRDAAGPDQILQNKELKQFMLQSKNKKRMLAYKQAIEKYDNRDHAWVKKNWEDMVKLQGYVNFLRDFTLVDERELQEVALWKDYLIYATLFGMGKEVLKKMKEINPEYLKMDDVAQAMEQTTLIPVFCNTFHHSYSDITPPSQRSSGGGGSISFGGGGGFSGGGFGGGVR